jgi:hypothetical protein
MSKSRRFLLPLALLLLPAAGGETSSVAPTFSAPTEITNVYAPFQPGAVKVYAGRSEGAALVIVDLFLPETRAFMLAGKPVECVTLQETEFEDGVISEISRNFFAQADDGAVYYFGEIVDHFASGQVTDHEGSWLVGGPTLPTDPAETATATAPSLSMPAAPAVGDTWHPENLPPVAQENAVALATDTTLKVRAGKFLGVLLVQETSDLEDVEVERKWYAPQVGLVKTQAKQEKLQLVSTMLVQEPSPVPQDSPN